jgi:Pheromone A receptor
MIIYHFIKHKYQMAEVMSSHHGHHRSRYIRLMLLATTEMIITVPYSTYLLVDTLQTGLIKFSWSTLRHNYTHVPQFTTVEWQSDPLGRVALEMDNWALVYCAFAFFGFFGFSDEARGHYRRVYSSITRRVGFSKSSGTLTGSSHAYVVQSGARMLDSRLCSMSSSKTAGVMASVVKPRTRRDSILSVSDRLSIPSISIASLSDLKSDFKIEQDSPLESTVPSSSSSFANGPLDQLPQLPDDIRITVELTSTYTTDGADAV